MILLLMVLECYSCCSEDGRDFKVLKNESNKIFEKPVTENSKS